CPDPDVAPRPSWCRFPSSRNKGRVVMAATKTTKTKATAEKAKKATKAEAPEKKSTKASDKPKLSALDAAAKVLGEADKAMNCKEMIDAMAAKGYWKSPGGATPWATLYAAIVKEIATKGKEAWFKKSEPGKFTLA